LAALASDRRMIVDDNAVMNNPLCFMATDYNQASVLCVISSSSTVTAIVHAPGARAFQLWDGVYCSVSGTPPPSSAKSRKQTIYFVTMCQIFEFTGVTGKI
jgi:hypothetical protein